MKISEIQKSFREYLTVCKWESQHTDKEDIELGVEKVCEEIERLMAQLDGERETFILIHSIMCLMEHHIENGFGEN